MAITPEINPQDQTIAQPGATLRLRSQSSTPFLVVLFPRELYARYPLNSKKPLILGRSNECEVHLADELVSRRHCEVIWKGGQVLVRDLESTNGTFVDGSRIREKTLAPNHRLQVGGAVLKVEFKDTSEIEREKELFEAATTDGLTKVGNRRWFREQAQSDFALARRGKSQVHLILLDVDFFKKVNDTHGHPAGDFVLREIAELLHREKREEDLLARYGGEEFILLVRQASAEQALALAERLRRSVEIHRFHFSEKNIPVTISLGLSTHSDSKEETLDCLISRADKALYRSKQEGRNRVSVQQ